MLYITGDTHGNQYKWVEQIDPALSPGDTIIVCGDFGIGFWNGRYWSEETFFDFLSEQAYTVLFIDGNHEDFNKLAACPVESWCGGKVHVIRRNVLHLIRGEIYSVEGHSIFVFGGGYSLDRSRRVENVSWWPQEMPSREEYLHAEANLQRVNHQVDYIITHTAPGESVYYLSTFRRLGIHNDVAAEQPLTAFLDEVQKTVSYRHWYFGHFHVDVSLWRNQTAMLSTIRELVSGTIIREWPSYEG